MKMKKVSEHYSSPTPAKWRKLGDSLLATSASISGTAIVMDNKPVAIAALAIGVVGKFLSNFFKKEDVESPEDAQ
jgi:hypothetical protein